VFNDNSGLTSAPAEGTVVRFVATAEDSLSPVDTFTFSVPPYQVITTGTQTAIVYIKYKLYNRGGNTINDFYVSLWADPDLGGPSDDLVGCDTSLDIFYCYNGTNADAQYGASPPAIGFKLIDGPVVPGTYEDTAVFDGHVMPGYRNVRMSGFSLYVNGTDPDGAVQSYYYMQGLTNSGQLWPNGTHFAVPGDPVAGTGDLDMYPADRRMMGSFGPFDFLPGDSQYVLIKMAIGSGSNRLESITRLFTALQTPPPPQSAFLLKAVPDPFHTYWLNAFNPLSASVVFGYSAAGDPGVPIDWSSVAFAGLPAPDSTKILASYPGFTGEVLQYFFNPHDLLTSLGTVWDMTSYPVSVTGSYNSEGSFTTSGDIPVQGHRSGDVNLDGDVNVGDVTALVGILFRGEPLPDPPEIADVDGLCGFNISDLTYLVANMFAGGDEPKHCTQ